MFVFCGCVVIGVCVDVAVFILCICGHFSGDGLFVLAVIVRLR